MLVNVAGNAYRPGFGEALHACGDVDPVAIEIVAVDDHIAQADADAQDDPRVLGQIGVALGEHALDLDRALDRVDGAAKLGKGPVTGVLEDAPVEPLCRRVEHLGAQRLEPREGPRFVLFHQP